MMATFRFASDYWGVTGFAEWVMIRRILAFLVPIMTMGVDVGLTRSLSQTKAGGNEVAVLSAVLIVFCATLVSSLFIMLFAGPLSDLLFGARGHIDLMGPLVAISAGYALYVLCYAVLRGQLDFERASFFHITAYGVIPLAVLLQINDSPGQTVFYTGVIVFFLSGIFLASRLFDTRPSVAELSISIRNLFGYGIGRMFAALLLMALSLVPAVLGANLDGITTAGYIAFSLSIVGLAGSASAPIQMVLLPLVSLWWVEGRQPDIRRSVRRMELTVASIALLAAITMPVIAGLVSALFLGHRDEALTTALAVSGLAVGPFLYFACARQVVDACSSKPLNTYSLCLALVAFCISFLVARLFSTDVMMVILISYVIALYVLALTTRRMLAHLLWSG